MTTTALHEPPARRLRIAYVTDAIHMRGGQERCSAEVLKRLAPRHDVDVVTVTLDGVDPALFQNVRLVQAKRKPYLRSVFEFYFAAGKAVAQGGEYDIVHANGGIISGANFVAAHYCQRAWGECLAQHPEVRRGTNAYHALFWRITGAMEQQTYRSPRLRGIAAVSGRTGRDLHRFYGADPEKTSVIYNGADPLMFSPGNRAAYRDVIRARYNIPTGAVLLLFVGEYNRKGLDTVVRAMARTKTATPYHLLAVGAGNPAPFGALAQSLGVADKVTFAPPTGNIEQVFGAADGFVFPTFFEPFGMVILEAMFSGVPVITTQIAGAAELIRHGETGYLVASPTDAAGFAEQIDALVSQSPRARADFGQAGLDSVRYQTWDRVAAQVESAYLRAASGSVAPARVDTPR